jgi:type IV secretion system protein TrbJ
MKRSRFLAALSLTLAPTLILAPLTPAHALIVYDPSNYAQNVLTAARTLQQINNQIRSLQNEAQSLLNEAKNLANLPLSVLAPLQAQIQQTKQLIAQAQNLAYDVQSIQARFAAQYKSISLSASDQALINDARSRWTTSVGAFEDALKVQAGVIGNLDSAHIVMQNLVTASQSASGALQAAQAGNQLLALQAQQLSDLTAMIAAQSRAQSLEAARQATSEAEGRERLRRFLGNP